MNEITALETQIASLRKKIALRESVRNAVPSEGQIVNSDVFINSAHQTLTQLCCDLILLKVHSGAWSALDVIERMGKP